MHARTEGPSAVARLEELRSQLQERRIGGLLASGAVDTAVSDLQPLIAALPFRESLRALQMEALYRSGRAEEALNAYHIARRTLLDEIGIEPGPELQNLHERILRGDPTLNRPTGPRAQPARDVEVHLPSTLTRWSAGTTSSVGWPRWSAGTDWSLSPGRPGAGRPGWRSRSPALWRGASRTACGSST